jgi:hypothetical protein
MVAHNGLKGRIGAVTLVDCRRTTSMRGVLRGRPSIAEPRGGDLGTMYAGGECGRGQADTSPSPFAGIGWRGKPKAAWRQRRLCGNLALMLAPSRPASASPSRRHSSVAQGHRSIACCTAVRVRSTQQARACTPQPDGESWPRPTGRGNSSFPEPYPEQNRACLLSCPADVQMC